MGVHYRMVASQKIVLLTGVFALMSFYMLPALAQERFINNEDGTVTDNNTGLMWAAEDNGMPINFKFKSSFSNSLNNRNN